ncbi:MAG: site-specific recombinase [Bacteroidota bacterium]
MKNVICYSRVSTDEQANQGYSLEYQEDIIKRYCNNKGYNIIKSFREDYSAKDFNRPKWLEIKSMVQERKRKSETIDAIIFLRPDRFSRNLLLSFAEITALSKIGCEVEFVEGQVDDSNPEALLLQAIGFALPEVENRKISKRSKEGSHKARLNGCFTGTPPRGYKCVRVGKDATLEFSKDADLIRESFEKMASGLYTADEVRRWLNGKGMKLSKNQFPNIIRNLTYSGKILVRALGNDPEQIVQGLHPALVSEELFAKANDVLNGRKRNMDFKSEKLNLYPLKGHLYCPTHGRTLSAYASTGRSGNKFHYYICTKPHVKCDRYPIEDVHNQVERILSNIQFSAQLLSTYRTALKGLFENDDINRKKNIQKSNEEIERLNKRRSFVEEQYMDGKLPAQEYQDLKNNINTRLFNEKNKLQELQEVFSPFREYLDKQVPMLEDLVGFYKSVDGRTKNKILGCIFSEKLYFEEKKVATPKFTTPIELLLNASKVLQNGRNKKEVKNDLFLQFAPPLGLEPRTL